MENAKDISIDEVVFLSADCCYVKQIVIADQAIRVDIHGDEAEEVYFLESERK